MKNKKIKREKKKSVAKEFYKSFATSFALVIVVLVVGFTFYITSYNKNRGQEDNPIDSNISKTLVIAEDRTGSTPDSIWLYIFNKTTGAIDLVAIPETLKMQVSAETYKKVKPLQTVSEDGREITIGEIGEELEGSLKYSTMMDVVTELVGNKIGNYIAIDMEDIDNVFSEIETINYNVKQAVNYSAPDGTVNELKAGYQPITISQAEEIFTYMGKEPSVALMDRISTQHDIINQLILEASQRSLLNTTILNSYSLYSTSIQQDDMELGVSKYQSIDSNLVHYDILPGEMVLKLGVDSQGSSYADYEFIINQTTTKTYFEDIFNRQASSVENDNQTEEVQDISSIGKIIKISNGTTHNGLAKLYQTQLVQKGFTVNQIDTYDQEYISTLIKVKEEGMGRDLVDNFISANIEVDSTLVDCDILIILGENDIK